MRVQRIFPSRKMFTALKEFHTSKSLTKSQRRIFNSFHKLTTNKVSPIKSWTQKLRIVESFRKILWYKLIDNKILKLQLWQKRKPNGTEKGISLYYYSWINGTTQWGKRQKRCNKGPQYSMTLSTSACKLILLQDRDKVESSEVFSIFMFKSNVTWNSITVKRSVC